MLKVPEYYAGSTGVLCGKYWSIVLQVPERYLHGIGLAPCEKKQRGTACGQYLAEMLSL